MKKEGKEREKRMNKREEGWNLESIHPVSGTMLNKFGTSVWFGLVLQH